MGKINLLRKEPIKLQDSNPSQQKTSRSRVEYVEQFVELSSEQGLFVRNWPRCIQTESEDMEVEQKKSRDGYPL